MQPELTEVRLEEREAVDPASDLRAVTPVRLVQRRRLAVVVVGHVEQPPSTGRLALRVKQQALRERFLTSFRLFFSFETSHGDDGGRGRRANCGGNRFATRRSPVGLKLKPDNKRRVKRGCAADQATTTKSIVLVCVSESVKGYVSARVKAEEEV